MSHDIGLVQDGVVVQVDRHSEGGTYVLGGTSNANLNVTYNYAKFFYAFLDKEKGICWLYGKKASDTVKRLEIAVKQLGTARDSDYWKATPGNAGYALNILLGWARKHPNAVWEGD